MEFPDTIFALSSGRLPSGVAVVRLSGPHALATLLRMASGPMPPRTLVARSIRDGQGALLDRGMAVSIPGPASVTGEDCGELHLHGGKAVVAAVLDALSAMPGLRAADPGEFTRRAFLNGKLDLVEAEALADLISAETEVQRRFALGNAHGRHAALYAGWRQAIIQARALVEAELDFSDQDDVPDAVAERAWDALIEVVHEIDRHLSAFHQAEMIRDGFKVVILGAPNAGKSSLLNALAGRDAAIVTEEAGTTRDLIEVALDLSGAKVRVVDTAGIRPEAGKVEEIGITRALDAAAGADLLLELVDMSDPRRLVLPDFEAGRLVVGTKSDLVPGGVGVAYDLTVSTRDGSGLQSLLDLLSQRAAAATSVIGDAVPFRARHLDGLHSCRRALLTAIEGKGATLELRAEELRVASQSLGRLAGQAGVEEVLDFVFSGFCVGK